MITLQKIKPPVKLPKVHLSHLYIVLPPQTLKAIIKSPFIHERFANADNGMPDFSAPVPTSHSLYIRGMNTYLELLSTNNPWKEPLGKGGIGFMVENEGEIEQVHQHLSANKDNQAEVMKRLNTWQFGSDTKTPWNHVVYLQDKKSRAASVNTWVSQYDPQYFTALYPSRKDRIHTLQRKEFLAPLFSQDKLLHDITAITLALDKGQRERLETELALFGFRGTGSQQNRTFERPDIRLNIVPATEKAQGILEIQLALQTVPTRKQTLDFGTNSRLVINKDRTANWFFYPAE